jgi:hypothetical protein
MSLDEALKQCKPPGCARFQILMANQYREQ